MAETVTLNTPAYKDIQVGFELPELKLEPINRTMLALFAGASHDHNPVHLDIDFARMAGLPDVFAHGMLSMAWLGRLLTGFVPQTKIRQMHARFLGITHLGNVITCRGKVVEKLERDGEKLLRVEFTTTTQYGEAKIQGEALIAL